MVDPSLAALCSAISSEFERDARGPGIAALLERYARAADDWRAHEYFKPDGYTRSLVFKDATYELLLLCWGAGQESPIHNHMEQNCWMAVLAGEIEEVQYACPTGPPCGRLEVRRALSFRRGQVAYISDDIGIHLVRPLGGPGCSLHLYSKPYDVCKVYDPETGVESIKELAYDGVDGERFAAPVLSSTVPAR